jgi:hypothetical protein
VVRRGVAHCGVWPYLLPLLRCESTPLCYSWLCSAAMRSAPCHAASSAKISWCGMGCRQCVQSVQPCEVDRVVCVCACPVCVCVLGACADMADCTRLLADLQGQLLH